MYWLQSDDNSQSGVAVGLAAALCCAVARTAVSCGAGRGVLGHRARLPGAAGDCLCREPEERAPGGARQGWLRGAGSVEGAVAGPGTPLRIPALGKITIFCMCQKTPVIETVPNKIHVPQGQARKKRTEFLTPCCES